MACLELQNVSKSYRQRRPHRRRAVATSTCRCREGEFVAIVGYSGAGKTTLISLIAGLTAPDSGTRHSSTASRSTGPGPERGVVFQNYSLLPWLTVYDNVRLAVDQVLPRAGPRSSGASTSRRYIALVNLLAAARQASRRSSPAACGSASRWRARSRWTRKVLLLDEPLSARSTR